MNEGYKLYHPKWHRRRMPIFWWLRRFSYVKFIFRELTSLAVLYAAVVLMAQIWALSRGEESYRRFTELLGHPLVLTFNVCVCLALLFHTVTWLNLAPRALVVRLGQRRLPDAAVLVAHYLAWIAVSAIVVWGVGR